MIPSLGWPQNWDCRTQWPMRSKQNLTWRQLISLRVEDPPVERICKEFRIKSNSKQMFWIQSRGDATLRESPASKSNLRISVTQKQGTWILKSLIWGLRDMTSRKEGSVCSHYGQEHHPRCLGTGITASISWAQAPEKINFKNSLGR